MPSVKFPALMKYYVDNQSEFIMQGENMGVLIENVLVRYPSLKPHLLGSNGEMRRYFNVFVNGVHIRDLDGMNTKLKEDDKVIFMASAAGG